SARQFGLGHLRRRQHGGRDRVHGDRRAGARISPLRVRLGWRATRLRPLSLHRGPGRRGGALGAPVALHRLGRGADRRRRAARGPAGIGLSGQMHGLVALGGGGEVLRPAILWNDQRTAAETEEIESTVGVDRLIALTGNRALTGFTAPKLLWLRKHEPDVFERIASILLPKDYVRLRLYDERAIDVADASGTLLFDVANRRWSDEVCRALDLPVE